MIVSIAIAVLLSARYRRPRGCPFGVQRPSRSPPPPPPGRRELEHLPRHGGGEPVDARDAVLHFEHGPDLAHVDFGEIGRLDFLEEDFFELAGTKDRISGHGDTGWRL